AYHISVGSASTQARLLPFSGEEVALFTRRAFWDVDWVRRSGTDIPGRTVGVVGVVAMGEEIHVGTDLVIISPTGLLPAPDPALPARYHDLGVARVAAIAGLRQITYITVRGFDAVRATQDVGIGTQFGLLLGPSVWATAGDADLFLASDFYAGGGDAGTFYTARVLAEARGNHQSMRWDGLVGNARFSLSSRTSANWTTHASLEGSILQSLSFPSQLTFRDTDGGVRGYANAIAAGGRRAQPALLPQLERQHDLGVVRRRCGKPCLDDQHPVRTGNTAAPSAAKRPARRRAARRRRAPRRSRDRRRSAA
ncbi:MAG: hypothetical protein WCG92_15445, partial [Hyphomicrobiales bacterium]